MRSGAGTRGSGAGSGEDPAAAALRRFLQLQRGHGAGSGGARTVEEAQSLLESDLVAAADAGAPGTVPPLPAALLDALLGLMRGRDLAAAKWGVAGACALIQASALRPAEFAAVGAQVCGTRGMAGALAACMEHFLVAGYEQHGHALKGATQALHGLLSRCQAEAAAADEVLNSGVDPVVVLGLVVSKFYLTPAGTAPAAAAEAAVGALTLLLRPTAPRRLDVAARCAEDGAAVAGAIGLLGIYPFAATPSAEAAVEFIHKLLRAAHDGSIKLATLSPETAERLACGASDMI